MDVPDLLLTGASRFPERACVIQGGRTLSFGETSARASRLAQAFADHGLRPGDRVALLALSELEYLEIQVAAQRAGVILVPLNFRLAAAELTAIFADCEPRLLIHGPGFEQQAAALSVPATWHLGEQSVGEAYDELLAGAQAHGEPGFLDSAAPCSILYTSGTTGRPKGAVISNGGLWARLNSWGFETGMRAGDVFVSTLPMFHVAAHAVYAFTYQGATVVLLPSFDVAETLRAVEEHGATHVVFVPTMISRVLDHLATRPARLERLRTVMYGAAAISPDVLRRAIETLGCEFWQGYGLTEAVAVSALRPADHDPVGHPERLASAGTDSIGYQVRVVDADDRDVPPGEIGEIVIRGPGVMDGYWNAPEVTAEVMRGGWLHSGDLGYRSPEGYLYLTDRLKDMIVTGGENVYSREVEDALHAHEDVLEVAVIGIPSAEWGEAVHAVVVGREGARLEPAALVAHCRERLAGYKVPKSIDVVAGPLPKNASEKILKREIRARYWEGADRAIG